MSKSYDATATLQVQELRQRDKDGFAKLGEPIEYEVYVSEESIERSEFYAAAREGIAVNMILKMPKEEYDYFIETYKKNPVNVMYQEKKYEIVRTFCKQEDDAIELILKEA